MKAENRFFWILAFTVVLAWSVTIAEAQRFSPIYLVSNGPDGPIYGGESAVTDMILMDNGWVYGSTEATWGSQSCHLFRTDSTKSEHVLCVTEKLPGQVKVNDLSPGPDSTLIGGTTTYNEIFDDAGKSYEGGHIFSYKPETNTFKDLGIVQNGQGINCVAYDKLHKLIYCVTYPAAHLFSLNHETGEKKDYGQVMKPWRVKDLGKVSWRGVPKVLMIDNAGSVYYSTYVENDGGRIFMVPYGDDVPVFTGALVPTQKGMDNDPIYENTIMSAIRAYDGGFWCGSSVDGFLFKFYPSTATIVNKGKPFNYWNLRSLAYGGDGKLYMLGGRNYDNPWLLCYDGAKGSIDSIGWPASNTQCGIICADKDGAILMAENLRNSYIRVYQQSK